MPGTRHPAVAVSVVGAVDVTSPASERRRVLFVECVLEPQADAVTTLRVEVIRGAEIDEGVIAVIDAADSAADDVVHVSDVHDRKAELERNAHRGVIEAELHEALRHVLNLLAAAFQLRLGTRVAEAGRQRWIQRDVERELPALEVDLLVEVLEAAVRNGGIVEV